MEYGSAVDVYGNTAEYCAEITVNDLTVTYDDEIGTQDSLMQMAFKGWAVVPDSCQTPEEIKAYTESADVRVIETDTILISRTTRLYPVFEPICWLDFNTSQDGPGSNANHYTGATYKPPLYFPSDEGFDFSQQTPPALAGYQFDGWFTGEGVQVTDEDLTPVSGLLTNDLEIRNGKLFFRERTPRTAEVTLYAHWIPSDSSYTIVLWKQKVTDPPDLPDAEKKWDFDRSEILTALTGSVVSVGSTYTSLHETGFSFLRADPPTAVRGDGKTILNVYYERNKYTFTFKRDNRTIYTVSALYGADISGIWNFTGSDGISYPVTSGTTVSSWDPKNSNSSQYTARITQMLLMPAENLTFEYYIWNNQKRTFHYYVEALPETEHTIPYNEMQFIPYNDNMENVENDFNMIYYNDDFFELNGFTRFVIAAPDGTNVTSTIQYAGQNGKRWDSDWHNELYFYYTRNSYTAEFIDSFHNQLIGEKQEILFEDTLERYIPEVPPAPEGYEFTGWYADEACSTPIAFTEAEAERFRNSGTNFQEYSTMPAHAIRVYAGWQTQWFKVEIDPNGGVLTGTQATWFWEPYNGDPIEEYKTVTRNFEPDVNGMYYYAFRNRAYYGLGEEWDPAEDTTYRNQIVDDHCTRGAFYTTDLSLASDMMRYKEFEDAYRYLGWFEVDPDTGNAVQLWHAYSEKHLPETALEAAGCLSDLVSCGQRYD